VEGKWSLLILKGAFVIIIKEQLGIRYGLDLAGVIFYVSAYLGMFRCIIIRNPIIFSLLLIVSLHTHLGGRGPNPKIRN